MKKSLLLACLVCAFAGSGFAQSVPAAPATAPAQAGAKRVAERDAEWRKAHPGGAVAAQPQAVHKLKAKKAHAVKADKHAKRAKHAKTVKHHKPVKHAKPGKHKVKKTV